MQQHTIYQLTYSKSQQSLLSLLLAVFDQLAYCIRSSHWWHFITGYTTLLLQKSTVQEP